ncbi:murein transglycosylase [Exophiala aquamarina CBS 119918]|uniref:Murein transglycosylase n=1 Tax=Exophiala aquamarina CBS 119918 TaxID=1182545 RepID=A0A072PDX5_9EURO|nr:murein transglycosylase [Exophiala aquamarina CBS 119918]KEF57503.1 murein transglycosylase [Exophiala aquamarina CBS 119918]
MKFTSIALTAVSASIVLAQPHNHGHQHVHKHKRDVTETAWAPGPTAYKYVLNGEEISAEEVCEGLQDNELKFVDGQDPGVCSSTWSSSSAPSTTTQPTTTIAAATSSAAESWSKPAEFYQSPGSSGWASPSEAATSWSSPAQSSSTPSSGTGATGIDADFPDGQLDCNTFPSAYGAVPVNYLGMSGWSGLQAVSIAGGLVNHIVTGISGDGCKEGSMCSYACPPGMQKSQWPSTQGATGQSVGGLSCSGGKLRLTNPGLSTKLCIPGVGGVQATNKASGVVAICRTDYPGTESETIPVELQPGQTDQLTVPDAATYYEWQGKSTSAQYYLNPIGTSKEKGCQWGTPGQPYGNYAPINFGVGAKDGKTWLSIFQNSPTTDAQYQGTVEIQGNLSGTCKYSNGQYCGVTGCNSQGCTVAVISGTATYVVSD